MMANSPRWLVGVLFALCGAAGTSLGVVTQKFAHEANEKKPKQERRKVIFGMLMSPMWLFGFLLLTVLPIPFHITALTLAGQSLITPLGGVTIVFNQVIAPTVLKEEITLRQWFATFLILFGALLSTAFGSHHSPSYTIEELIALYKFPFLGAEFTLITLCILGVIVARYQPPWSLPLQPLIFSFLSGAFGAQQNICLKGVGEMLSAKDGAEFHRWEFWALVVGVVALALLQLAYLNKGLVRFTAVTFIPLYNVCLILLGTALGLLYFEEYATLSHGQLAMFATGCATIVAGVVLLMRARLPGRGAPSVVAPTATGAASTSVAFGGVAGGSGGSGNSPSAAAIIRSGSGSGSGSGNGGGGNGGGGGAHTTSPVPGSAGAAAVLGMGVEAGLTAVVVEIPGDSTARRKDY